MRSSYIYSVLGFLLVSLLASAANGDERIVSSLADSGPGSFRDALRADGPAVLRFDVEGDIFLESPIELKGADLTVDVANSVSGSGVRLIGFGMKITGSNFRLHNLRIWVGDRFNDSELSSKQDGIVVFGTEKRPVENGKILNCTIFAAVDEGISTSGPVSSLDIGRNMVLYCLSKSHHRDVAIGGSRHHSMAILAGEGARNVRYAQNLLALNQHRNPRVMPDAEVGFVNNIVYGWGSGVDDAFYFANTKKLALPLKVAFVNNYYQGIESSYYFRPPFIPGPNKGNILGSAFRLNHASYYSVWDTGNVVKDSAGLVNPFSLGHPEIRTDQASVTEASFRGLLPEKVLTAAQAYAAVIRYAGAFPDHRDKLELSVVELLKNGGGKFIDSPRELPVDYPYSY